MTLNGEIISPENIFEKEQLYVVLSRVKDHNNLFLTSKIDLNKIMVDSKALEFYNKLENESLGEK